MIRLRALLTILIVGGGIYVGSKVAPAYYTYYQFQSDLEQAAITESYTTRSEANIQESVAARGRDYGIPLRLEQIRVRRSGNELSISTEYTIHIDLPIYSFDLKFAPMTKNRRI
jgi:hypothetical protein